MINSRRSYPRAKVEKQNRRELQKAIKELHSCDSSWIRSVHIREDHEGKLVWDGDVEVFELIGHPTAKLCYAWSHTIDGSTKRKYIAVLHQLPVDSPQAAVRAAIIQEYREKQAP